MCCWYLLIYSSEGHQLHQLVGRAPNIDIVRLERARLLRLEMFAPAPGVSSRGGHLLRSVPGGRAAVWESHSFCSSCWKVIPQMTSNTTYKPDNMENQITWIATTLRKKNVELRKIIRKEFSFADERIYRPTTCWARSQDTWLFPQWGAQENWKQRGQRGVALCQGVTSVHPDVSHVMGMGRMGRNGTDLHRIQSLQKNRSKTVGRHAKIHQTSTALGTARC